MVTVLSGLAKGFAVCDHWYSSVPTETFPNRAFALSGTSLGRLDDSDGYFATPSIFGSLSNAKPDPISWKIYGYVLKALTISDYPDTVSADPSHFGLVADFQSDAANGQLPGFSFLEPAWSKSGTTIEKDQHPVANVALGEKFIYDVYHAVRASPSWNRTLLILTYDEHGGNYDHIAPPTNAASSTPASSGFDFTRFGVRVPSVLVSPLIEAGTIFRPAGATPLDHTSILATIEKKFGLTALTSRDAAAPDLEAVLNLDPASPNTVDPLAGVTVPVYQAPVGADVSITEQAHQVLLHHATLAASLPVVGEDNAAAAATADRFLSDPSPNGEDVAQFIEDRLTKWPNQTSIVHANLRPGNQRHPQA
jgi:phospholipase C